MANMENLKLMHHKQIGLILETVVEILRMTEREYAKRVREVIQEKRRRKKKRRRKRKGEKKEKEKADGAE